VVTALFHLSSAQLSSGATTGRHARYSYDNRRAAFEHYRPVGRIAEVVRFVALRDLSGYSSGRFDHDRMAA
jgi:hypothetical protein